MPSVSDRKIEQRARNAFLGLAIGDALGATVEFLTPREIQTKHGVHRDIIGAGWLHLQPGQVTDDTEMALALADAIVEAGGRVVSETVARHFSDWMAGKPKDIGHTVRRGLKRFRRTGQAQVPPDPHSAGNGGAMRMLPAVIATLGRSDREMHEAVLAQARITHHCEEVDAATLALAEMMRAALLGAGRAEILAPADRLEASFPQFATTRRRENPSGYIVETYQAVVQAYRDHTGAEAALIDVVNRGGDADTTGAILGGIVGVNGMPDRWIKALDPGIKIRIEAVSPDPVP